MTPVERALKAAEQEFRAHQRHDLAEADYRRKHRLFCEALAALEAGQGNYDASFSVFCKEYEEKRLRKEVEDRGVRSLQQLRKSGTLTIPDEVVEAVEPTKILHAAAAVTRKTNPLPAEQVAVILASSTDDTDTVEQFKKILDISTPLLPEDVPKPKRRLVKELTPKALAAQQAAAEAGQPPESTPEEQVMKEAVVAQLDSMRKSVEESQRALDSSHPAMRHIEKAILAVNKYAPTAEQAGEMLRRIELVRDKCLAVQHEIVGDSLTDEKLQEFLDNES